MVTISFCCHRYIVWEISVINTIDVIRTTLVGEVVYTSSKFVEEMDDFNGG